MHKHECSKCGHIWEHDSSCAGDEREHSCPRCGEESWFRYLGDKPVSPKIHRVEYVFYTH